MLIAWAAWIGVIGGICLLFWWVWKMTNNIERAEQEEEFERGMREAQAQMLEQQGYVREAQWVREGRKW
jgi:hypothetical protein